MTHYNISVHLVNSFILKQTIPDSAGGSIILLMDEKERNIEQFPIDFFFIICTLVEHTNRYNYLLIPGYSHLDWVEGMVYVIKLQKFSLRISYFI